MGLIRKTLSVGTLGVIAFRSKKEKLERADGSRRAFTPHRAMPDARKRILAVDVDAVQPAALECTRDGFEMREQV